MVSAVLRNLVLSATLLGATCSVIIETYAGMSDSGCPYLLGSGWFNPALSQGLAPIIDLTFDENTGDAYYAMFDCGVVMLHNRTTNMISVLAGNAVDKVSYRYGDNGPATSARIYGPMAVKLDPDSKYLYIGDGWATIRRVEMSTQIITTVAGLDNPVPYSGYNGDDGAATSAQFSTFGGGFYFNTSRYLFVTDGLTRIRRIDFDLNIVQNYAGSVFTSGWADGPLTDALFGQPTSLWGDKKGTLYVFDSLNCYFRKIDMYTGMVSTWFGSRCVSAGDGAPIQMASSSTMVRFCGEDSAGVFRLLDLLNR